ncbi:cupin domain-containing protein [Leucobacter tenebrionis]|uniref:cupin domain-containing protein n=1 Tax=Leucobacter tenebrionis TaxID=2873270 RepID=UPI001CA7A645|nr:cupin domain-containing protein [Leucobacter tenebrionis]QZY50719.1 cupin domain-containing protein [Leucobacter tenebrionis]
MHDELGKGLRRQREARGLSLRSVATAVGVSASMLSQVETGKLHPSVPKLFEIAAYLEISVDSLLGLPSGEEAGPSRLAVERAVQRREAAPRIDIQNGVTWERLASAADENVEALLVTYDPGSSSSMDGKLMRHAGREFGYVLEGELTFRLGFETMVLRKGDSFSFDAQRPHVFTNESGAAAQGIWYVLPEQTSPSPTSEAGAGQVTQALRALQSGM